MHKDTSKLDGLEKILYVLDQLKRDTQKGKILWHLYQSNLVYGKPIIGGVNKVGLINLAEYLYDYKFPNIDYEFVNIAELASAIHRNWSFVSGDITDLVNMKMVKRHYVKRHVYLEIDYYLLVEMWYAVNNGIIAPYRWVFAEMNK